MCNYTMRREAYGLLCSREVGVGSFAQKWTHSQRLIIQVYFDVARICACEWTKTNRGLGLTQKQYSNSESLIHVFINYGNHGTVWLLWTYNAVNAAWFVTMYKIGCTFKTLKTIQAMKLALEINKPLMYSNVFFADSLWLMSAIATLTLHDRYWMHPALPCQSNSIGG